MFAAGSTRCFFCWCYERLDVATQNQFDEMATLRQTHHRRLQLLQLLAAQRGYSTPVEVKAEIQDIEQQIKQIDQASGKLQIQEARFLARALPPSCDGEYTSGDEVLDRLDSMGRYVLNVEDAVHREVGALLRLIDTRSMADDLHRTARQKIVDRQAIIIILLLISLVAVLLIKL